MSAHHASAQVNIFPQLIGTWRDINNAFTIVIEESGRVYSQDGRLSGSVERSIQGGGNFAFEGTNFRCAYDIVVLSAPMEGATSWGLRDDRNFEKCFKTGVFVRVKTGQPGQQDSAEKGASFRTPFFEGPSPADNPRNFSKNFLGKWAANAAGQVYFETQGALLGREANLKLYTDKDKSRVWYLRYEISYEYRLTGNSVSGEPSEALRICTEFPLEIGGETSQLLGELRKISEIPKDTTSDHIARECNGDPSSCELTVKNTTRKWTFNGDYAANIVSESSLYYRAPTGSRRGVNPFQHRKCVLTFDINLTKK